jgi:hypothetical protein
MTARVFRIYVMTSMFVDATRNALIFFFSSNLYIAHYDNGNNAIDIDI